MSESPEGPRELTVQEAAAMLKNDPAVKLYDVREDLEIATASIERAEQMTQEIAGELMRSGNREAPYIFMCHHGIRSLDAAAFFHEMGFKNVYSMQGGIHAWATEIDDSVPTY